MLDVIQEVQKLDLPLGQYAVIGSGVLAVHGIREARDVDMVVLPELLQKLAKNGEWKRKYFFHGMLRRQAYQNGVFEMYSNCYYKTYKPDTIDLIRRAEIIDGVAFMSLADLRDFKRALGRDKDFADIKLIDDYLVRQNNK